MTMAATHRYLAPSTLDEALRVSAHPGAVILAGGTDLLPRWSRGLVERPETIISLRCVSELRGISWANGGVHVGASTLLSEIAADPILRKAAPILTHAAGHIACPQVRNRATIGGNLCNASPAADTAVPLILVDATCEIASANGTDLRRREVAITDFFRGPGSTALARGEILTGIRFRPLTERTFAAWEKFGTRPAMEIAVASVGVAVTIEGGVIKHARVAYGSVAPVPLRGRRAEAELTGKSLLDETIQRCEAAARSEVVPITDVRAGEAYRREIVGVLLRRMLEDARRG